MERKEYVVEEKDYIDQSLTTKIITQVDEAKNEMTNKKFLLFTTRTCPNCRFAKVALDERGIKYDTILAEDDVELAKHYNISQVPTLIVVDNNKEVEQYTNYGNIAKYIQRQA